MTTDVHSAGLASGCHFTIEMSSERWWWNQECYELFGLMPGHVQPSTGLLRSQTSVGDRGKWRVALEHWDSHASTWAAVLGMTDANRRRFDAMVVGSVVDQPGGMVHGYLVDLSAPVRARAEAEASRQIQDFGHVAIEQAKGILSAMTGRSVEDSYLLLRQTATDRNIAMRTLARGVVEAAARDELSTLGWDSPLLGGRGRPVDMPPHRHAPVKSHEPPIGPGARRRERGYSPG